VHTVTPGTPDVLQKFAQIVKNVTYNLWENGNLENAYFCKKCRYIHFFSILTGSQKSAISKCENCERVL
jgi:hypothetical protein